MPQTREHVHVLELLGVTHMVVALTMCDLADNEMIELAELDVDDFLSGTVFADAPIVPVSSKTGEGIDGLLAVLDEQVSACWDACRDRAERTDAAPRLPIRAAALRLRRRHCRNGNAARCAGCGGRRADDFAVAYGLSRARDSGAWRYARARCLVSVWRST